MNTTGLSHHFFLSQLQLSLCLSLWILTILVVSVSQKLPGCLYTEHIPGLGSLPQTASLLSQLLRLSDRVLDVTVLKGHICKKGFLTFSLSQCCPCGHHTQEGLYAFSSRQFLEDGNQLLIHPPLVIARQCLEAEWAQVKPVEYAVP